MTSFSFPIVPIHRSLAASLLAVGLLTVGGFFVLGKLYWFSVPFIGIAISLACYVASIVVALA